MIRNISPEGSDRSDTADSAIGRVHVPDPSAVEIKPAVSVLMIKDGPTGIEVFVQHRVSTMDFAAGVVVFPGGRVDPVDRLTAPGLHVSNPDDHSRAWEKSSIAEVAEGWRILLATAVREVEEETGALLDPSALKPWANWVTPLGSPKRFDTYFYVTGADEVHAPMHRTTEAHKSEWMSVAGILEAETEGRLKLMRPTLALLGELNGFGSAGEVLAVDRIVDPVRPEFPSGRG